MFKRKLAYIRPLAGLLLGGALLAAVACGAPDPTPTPPPAATPPPGVDPTATPDPGAPAATATPAPVGAELPNPQSPAGTVTIAGIQLTAAGGQGLNSLQSVGPGGGVGEALFTVPIFEDHVGGDPTLPWLSTGWEFNDDLTLLTLDIQEGVQFHQDYGEMTAEDVAWNLNDVKSDVTAASINAQAGDHRALFDGAWRVVDQYTIEVDVLIPDPRMFAYNLGILFQGPAMFSKAHFDEHGGYDGGGIEAARDNVVATGPYELTEYLVDNRMVVDRVPYDHWRQNGQAQRVVTLAVPESSQRVAMMRTGEVDAADIPLLDRAGMLNDGFGWATTGLAQQLGIFFSGNLWETHHARTGEPLEIAVNQGTINGVPTIGNPHFANDRMESARLVRTALGHALDRDLINEAILDGRGWPVHHNYFNPNDPNWDEQWEYAYDPQLSQDLLAEAGFPDGFRTSLYIGPELGGGLGSAGDVGDAVAGFWDAVGVETEVLKYAYAAFRPSVVARTNTIPWLTGCDEGRSTLPWDWPKGLVMTSMTRGGFGCGFESEWIAENFLDMVREPDLAARTQMANDFLDYIHHWSLEIGVVAVPTGRVYNPQAIESWPMRLSAGPETNNIEAIVPAR